MSKLIKSKLPLSFNGAGGVIVHVVVVIFVVVNDVVVVVHSLSVIKMIFPISTFYFNFPSFRIISSHMSTSLTFICLLVKRYEIESIHN